MSLRPASIDAYSMATLAPHPRDERDTEPDDDGDDPAARRDPRRLGELRHLGLGGGAEPCGTLEPGRLIAVDDPRSVVGEGRPLAVGRVRHGPRMPGSSSDRAPSETAPIVGVRRGVGLKVDNVERR